MVVRAGAIIRKNNRPARLLFYCNYMEQVLPIEIMEKVFKVELTSEKTVIPLIKEVYAFAYEQGLKDARDEF